MSHLLLLGSCLLAASPAAPPTSPDVKIYEAARASAGRDPEAHVKLALWCEAHGLKAERLRHLALAVVLNPNQSTARGLMGLVAFRGHWSSPAAATRAAVADEALAAKLARYNALRNTLLQTYGRDGSGKARAKARDAMKLALWCEENGLKPEAIAHFMEATQLDPSLKTPWEHLGCHKHKGRWMTPEQIAAEAAEAKAQERADRHWTALLLTWKGWLDQPQRQHPELEERFASVTDPRAVPSVWKVFANQSGAGQRLATRLLAQIDSPEASRALVDLSIFGATADVRQCAAQLLGTRDSRDVVLPLIGLLWAPVRYTYIPPDCDSDWKNRVDSGSLGKLFVEGKHYNLTRTYVGSKYHVAARNQSDQLEEMIENQLARTRLLTDVQEIEHSNAIAEQVNARVRPILQTVTGLELGEDSDSWMVWWADQQGYVYEVPNAARKPTYKSSFTSPKNIAFVHTACFGAGTPVQTLSGTRRIESIQVGDQVLAQDARDGTLRFQPVVKVYTNPPSPTLRIAVGQESIVTTGIHRFWKAGQGWTMAHDLKPGDLLRIVGGTAQVVTIDAAEVQPVYNLDVASDRNFFVGSTGCLVHDHSLVRAGERAFDAVPELAAGTPINP